VTTLNIDLRYAVPEGAKPRRKPSQKRAEETCATILEAATAILAEPGATQFTTNHIAQRAGINIATFYRYYASTEAILVALFHRQAYERRDALIHLFKHRGNQPWQETVHDIVDQIVTDRRSQPGCSSLRRQMHTFPELREIDRELSLAAGDMIGRAIGLDHGMPAEQAQAIALVATDMLTALLDLWEQENPRLEQAKIDELKKALVAYLTLYIG